MPQLHEQQTQRKAAALFATMGHMANSEGLQLQKQVPEYSDFITIPVTPNTTFHDTMNESRSEHSASQGTVETPSKPPSTASTSTVIDAVISSDPSQDDEISASVIEDDEHDFIGPNTTLVIPITNPSAFPIQRIQEVQSQHFPSTFFTNMLCHLGPSKTITQVTADVQDGSVNHLLIRDPRLISALGLVPPDFDTIELDITKLRIDEKFAVRIFPGQYPQKLDEWIMGELVSARHAYLYWLDERKTANPDHGPYAAEAKVLARKLGRRWPDIMKEIERVWRLEHGSNQKEYRENRMKYLGEDPTYPAQAKEARIVRSMFG